MKCTAFFSYKYIVLSKAIKPTTLAPTCLILDCRSAIPKYVYKEIIIIFLLHADRFVHRHIIWVFYTFGFDIFGALIWNKLVRGKTGRPADLGYQPAILWRSVSPAVAQKQQPFSGSMVFCFDQCTVYWIIIKEYITLFVKIGHAVMLLRKILHRPTLSPFPLLLKPNILDWESVQILHG